MGSDLVSENDPDHHRDRDDTMGELSIPSPRPAPDDHIENLPRTDPDQSEWWYDQRGKRGKNRRYIGYVTRIDGAEGDRIRGELAAIIRDLLNWAKQQTETESDHESDRESEQDGAADDNPA